MEHDRVFIVVMIGVAIAWVPVVKETQGGQVFLYIQEVTNYLAPPVACVYLVAILWPRCNEQGCFWGLLAGFVTGVTRLVLVFVYRGPQKCGDPDNRPGFIKDFHYMYFAMVLFWITFVVTVVVSLFTEAPPYKRLYRTLFWTRRDTYAKEEVNSGHVIATWHGVCSYTVSNTKVTQTYDNPAHEADNGDDVCSTSEKRNTTIQEHLDDEGKHPKHASSNIYHVTGATSAQKRSCREFMYSWFCGVAGKDEIMEAENEKAKKREDIISSLEQNKVVRRLLFIMMLFMLLIGIALYCFWSIWKYNPEGDVWTRLEQGQWNITDYRYDI